MAMMPVPKLLKHSNSENVSRLPEINNLKLRSSKMIDQRIMPDAQLRNLTCRTNSMKKVMQSGIMTSVTSPSARHTGMKALQAQR